MSVMTVITCMVCMVSMVCIVIDQKMRMKYTLYKKMIELCNLLHE